MWLSILLWIAAFALNLLLTPKPQNAKAASLEDFEAPTAEEGREIPVLFGTRTLIGPNVVWYGDLQSKAIKGKRRYIFFGPRQTTGHKYYIGMHMGICHGPADNITQIRVGEKIAWEGVSAGGSISISKPDLFGGKDKEGGIEGIVDIDMGGPAQGKNDYLMDKLGAGVPAFRGVVCAILRHVYIGTVVYLKPWDFKIQRVYITSSGATQWYPEKAGVTGGFRVFWYQKCEEGDKARMGLEFLASGVSMGAVSWNDFTGETEWTLRSSSGIVPAGATHVRVWMGFQRTTTEAYIDDISLSWNGSSLSVTNPGAESGTSGWTTSSGGLTTDGNAHTGGNAFSGGSHSLTTAYQDVDLTALSPTMSSPLLDMNPAHIIRECLTDRLWGMGYNAADMDDTSFTNAANTLYAEGFGMTLLWQREEEIQNFIIMVLSHINGVLYTSRETGKFILKLIRRDYSLTDLYIVTEDDVVEWDEIKRRQPTESANSVVVNYYDSDKAKDAGVTVHNTAAIQQAGGVISASRSYPGISYKELAIRVGTRDVHSLGSGLADGSFLGKRTLEGLYPGDCFRLVSERHAFQGEVMRVVETKQGDGRRNGISIKFVEDVFSLDADVVVDTSGSQWVNPISDPLPVTPRMVIEMPWHELVRAIGRVQADDLLSADNDFGDVQIAGSAPTPDSIDALIEVDSGAGYVEADETLFFCPSTTLTENLGGTAAHTSAVIDIPGGIDLDDIIYGGLAYIGGEFVRVNSLTVDTLIIDRGCLDTVPIFHAAGAPIIFFDDLSASDYEPFTAGQALDVKLLTRTGSGVLLIADAPVNSVTLDSRAIRPYPPGRFKVDGSFSPPPVGTTATLTWTHRDRVGQTTVVPHDDVSYGPEGGVTYRVDITGLNNVGTPIAPVPFVSDNVGTALIYVYDQGTDPVPVGTVDIRFEVTAVRAGYDSWTSPRIQSADSAGGNSLGVVAGIATATAVGASTRASLGVSYGVGTGLGRGSPADGVGQAAGIATHAVYTDGSVVTFQSTTFTDTDTFYSPTAS